MSKGFSNNNRSEKQLLKRIATYLNIAFVRSHYAQPDLHVDSFNDISEQILEEYNISRLIIDLDQTTVVQGTSEIPLDFQKRLRILVDLLGGGNICFLTNEPNPKREQIIEAATGIKVVSGNFRKPEEAAYKAALQYLHVNNDKTTAVIGDRVWTDIIGAKWMGLFTIQVKPISPKKDSIPTAIIRKGEGIFQNKHGKINLISIFLATLTMLGMGIVQFYEFAISLFSNTGILQSEVIPILKITHPFFVFSSFIFYWLMTINNINFGKGEYKNPIVYYFNTYPTFFRFLLCCTLLIWLWIFPSNMPDIIKQVTYFYSFFIFLGMVISLSSYYHLKIIRTLRVVIDILIVWIIASSLPYSWGSYTLLMYLVPIGTAARYFEKIGIALTLLLCIATTLFYNFYYAPDGAYLITSIFILLYIAVAIIIILEHKETVFPLDSFLKDVYNDNPRNLSIIHLLNIFAKIMHCQAVYYIKSRAEGFYYIHDTIKHTGTIDGTSNEEIFNYLSHHPQHIISGINNNPEETTIKQKHLLKELETIIRPPLKGGLISVVVASIPHKDNEYLIFTNNYTRNGVVRKTFSTRHLRSIYIFAIFLSILPLSSLQLRNTRSIES